MTAWTDEEDYILATCWPTGGTKACRTLLPRRSAKAIRARAGIKGLYVHNRKWKQESTAPIVDNHTAARALGMRW